MAADYGIQNAGKRFLFRSTALAIALLACFGCSEYAGDRRAGAIPRPANDSRLVLSWSIANSGSGIGRTGWNIEEGWPAFIERHVRPGIEWCEASGVRPIILIHHAFGQWEDKMHLDGWDFAKAEQADFLTEDFATDAGWKSIAKDYDCYAYVGDVEIVDRLRNLPRDELAAAIRRNLQPYVDAGFKGVYVDYGENAVSERYEGAAPKHSAGPSADVLLLEIADEMFPEPAGVEAAPRIFPPFESLHRRNVIIRDPTWRHRFGGFTPEQEAKYVGRHETNKKTRRYGPRHAQAAKLGWPDRNYLRGTVWRTLIYGDAPAFNAEMARLIAAEGDVAVVSPQPFIQAKMKASELLSAPPIL